MPGRANLQRFKCRDCTKTFALKRQLISHQAFHNERIVNEISAKKREITARTVHDIATTTLSLSATSAMPCISASSIRRSKCNKVRACNHCNETFDTVKALRSHHYSQHRWEKKFKCRVCGIEFSWHENLLKHEQVHEIGLLHVCHVCNTKFHSEASVRLHILNRHQCYSDSVEESNSSQTQPESLKLFTCAICGRGFKFDFCYRAHLSGHVKQPVAELISAVQTEMNIPAMTDTRDNVLLRHSAAVITNSNDEMFVEMCNDCDSSMQPKAQETKNEGVATVSLLSSQYDAVRLDKQMNTVPQDCSGGAMVPAGEDGMTLDMTVEEYTAPHYHHSEDSRLIDEKEHNSDRQTSFSHLRGDIITGKIKPTRTEEAAKKIKFWSSSKPVEVWDNCMALQNNSISLNLKQEVIVDGTSQDQDMVRQIAVAQETLPHHVHSKLPRVNPDYCYVPNRLRKEKRPTRKPSDLLFNCVMTSEKPFVCKICSMAFRWEISLDVHTKTHTGDDPIPNSRKCHQKPVHVPTAAEAKQCEVVAQQYAKIKPKQSTPAIQHEKAQPQVQQQSFIVYQYEPVTYCEDKEDKARRSAAGGQNITTTGNNAIHSYCTQNNDLTAYLTSGSICNLQSSVVQDLLFVNSTDKLDEGRV